MDSLNDDQKTALENQVKDVQKKMKQLDTWSKELRAELESKNADQGKIREQVKKIDKLSKAIQKEQHHCGGRLVKVIDLVVRNPRRRIRCHAE